MTDAAGKRKAEGLIQAAALQEGNLARELKLLAAQGEAATLRATVAAQEAHIDSLKRALDGEQALHMASLQQRIPADTRGQADTGRSFMNWLKGWGKK